MADGYRSLLAFWMGGAADPGGTPAPTTPTVGGRVLRQRKRHRGDLKAAYEALIAEWLPAVKEAPAIAAPVASIVRPFAKSSDAILPPAAAVDFAAIEQSADASRRLAAALDEMVTAARVRREAAEDEEDMADLMAVIQALR